MKMIEKKGKNSNKRERERTEGNRSGRGGRRF